MVWVELEDKKSGRKYYYDKETKKTQWTKPDDFDAVSEPYVGDKDEWVCANDEASGRAYYYNKVTKETRWTKPECFAADEDVPLLKKKGSSKAAASSSGGADEADLGDPRDWKEVMDKASGRPYYYNKLTKKTSWKKPKGFDAAMEAVAAAKARAAATPQLNRDDSDSDEDAHDNGASSGRAMNSNDAASKSDRYHEYDEDSGGDDYADNAEDDEYVETAKDLLAEDDGYDLRGNATSTNFQFAKHRKGFINRAFHIGRAFDETKLLSYKKSLIKKALLKQNREYDAEAIQSFKNIMSYMGDRKTTKNDEGHARKLIFNGLQAPESLKDEVFLQVCKQVTGHPTQKHCVKGWELMSILLAGFPPSRGMSTFLEDYYAKAANESPDEDIVRLASICLERLPKIMQLGPRSEVPSTEEIRAEQRGELLHVKVYTLNNQCYTVEVSSFTPMKEVCSTMVHKIGLGYASPFSVYEFTKDGEERILDGESRVVDVIASWERLAHENKITVQEPFRMVFKAELVLKTTDRHLIDDEEAVKLMYIQAVHDVTTERYPPEEKDCASLAALHLQAQFGDYQPDTHNDTWMKDRIASLMPGSLFKVKKGKKYQAQVAEYSQKILTKFAKLRGVSSQEAQLSYLDYVQDWALYGASFVTVEQKQLKDYPPYIKIAVTCDAILLVHPDTIDVLDTFGYHEIVTWGYSDEKFILVVGNLVQQRKLFFKTNRGKFMNKLVHDYVKTKVPSN